MRILVAGAAGYIGSEVVRQAVAAGHEVLGFDSFDATLYNAEIKHSRAANLRLQHGVHIAEYNPITEGPQKVSWDGLDCIINEMAIPGLSPSWEIFDKYVASNLTALEAMVRHVMAGSPEARIVHASTSSVYGNTSKDRHLSPLSPYGVTKLAAENLLQAFHNEFGLEVSTLRYFSVFGGSQRPDMAYSKFIKRISQGLPITIFGDGSQSRTNTHVIDVARATISAATNESSNFTLDVSGEQEVSVSEAVTIIEQVLKRKAIIEYKDVKPGDQSFSRGDLNLASKILGWKPEIGFEDGIKEQISTTLSEIDD